MELVVAKNELAQAAQSAASQLGFELERLNIEPVNKASDPFLDGEFKGVCEIPIVTLLQAQAFGLPVVLLPITTLGRFQHQTLATMNGLSVNDVEGRTIGVRSWSQTTGVWVRGFLSDQYGVDLRTVDWVVFEGAHLAEYEDPSWVRRAPAGRRLPSDFLAGEVDFGIMGNELPDDARIRTAIPDAHQAAEQWSRAKGFAPINHVMAVSFQAAKEHSEVICAAYDAMTGVIRGSRNAGPVNFTPCGFADLRGPFSQAAAYALEQDVLPTAVDFDDVIAASCEALGVDPPRLGG